MTFGTRLRQLRNDKNLTLRELEKEIDITYSSLGKYERNEREPDFDTLEKIASYFGVMVDWLIGRTDIKTFDEYVFINDVRRLQEKLKELDSEKRNLIVDIIDQTYLIINRHLDDESIESLKLIFDFIHNLNWFDNGNIPIDNSDWFEKREKDNPEYMLEFLSSHKNHFNMLLDELFKIQLKSKKEEGNS